MAKGNRNEMMLNEPVSALIPKMAVPTIIAQLITTVYNLVDTYFVSTLGTNATAAVGVNASLERVITMAAMLLGAGASSYIARLLGAGKHEDADTVLSTSIFTALAFGVVFAVACKMMIMKIVYFLGATEECVQYSIDYANYVLYAAPFMIAQMVLNMTLRGEGSATYSMIGMGIGGILNCFLDPIFIYKLNLGVAGASMATAISKTLSFCILIAPYIRKKTNVRMETGFIRYRLEHIKEVVSIGSASFFRSFFGVFAAIMINRAAGSYSTSALAGISVATRVMMFPFGIVLGFGQGYQPVVGYNWGAQRYDRVKESYEFAVKVSVIGSLIMGGLLFVFSKQVITLFNSSADGDVLRIGMLAIRTEAACLIAHAFTSITNMFYAGIGHPVEAFFTAIARQGYCLWIMLAILPKLFGIEGLAMCQGSADLLTLAIGIPLFFRAKAIIKARTDLQSAE
ncbi:MAG: MATE family efflux transporter [Erysipelotrichaceae bacterium]|nr:MATE family efflux transporter [Erysipelotrichaceae bacterium]